LNWKELEEKLELTYKDIVGVICSKRYLGGINQIKLINAVAQTKLAYRMQFVLFSQKWTEQLNEFTTKTLNRSNKIPNTGSQQFWHLIRGLKDLTYLNR